MCIAYTLKRLLNFIHLKARQTQANCHLLTPCVDHSMPPCKASQGHISQSILSN